MGSEGCWNDPDGQKEMCPAVVGTYEHEHSYKSKNMEEVMMNSWFT
jgi:hypothetical protein